MTEFTSVIKKPIMKILIATENKAKIQAVQEVFTQVFSDIQITSKKFPSNISDQPMSEEEGIQGALNRALNAKKENPDYDYYIGLEGYVDPTKYGTFLAGAVTIIDKSNTQGVGCSAKIVLPQKISSQLNENQELGPITQKLMADTENQIRHSSGTGGVLTKDLYNRVDEFKDATKCALAEFVSPELY